MTPAPTPIPASTHTPLPPILPVGTAVVLLCELPAAGGKPAHPRGTAGLVIAAPIDPDHAYRVRFPEGDERSLLRREVEVLSRFQTLGLRDGAAAGDRLREHGLDGFVIYRAVVGSRAYGLERDGSDTDRRGVYLPPAWAHWSVYGVPEQLENDATQECYWEFEKFLRLVLKGNPNALEVLYTPLVEHADPLANELLASRAGFLSKLIYQTFNGYAMSQFRKIEQDVRLHGSVKWKHAMHLIRLLGAGIAALKTGELPVLVREGRDELLAIRDGLVPWEKVDARRLALHAEFEAAFSASWLPERPDYEAADRILYNARAAMARKELLA